MHRCWKSSPGFSRERAMYYHYTTSMHLFEIELIAPLGIEPRYRDYGPRILPLNYRANKIKLRYYISIASPGVEPRYSAYETDILAVEL